MRVSCDFSIFRRFSVCACHPSMGHIQAVRLECPLQKAADSQKASQPTAQSPPVADVPRVVRADVARFVDFARLSCVAARGQACHSRHPWREARVPHGSPRSCPKAHLLTHNSGCLGDPSGATRSLPHLPTEVDRGPENAVLFLDVTLQGCHP